ncbi:hypothetical protein GALMADRAFT_153481 [Galerina marginata CBS 339.88]|uniref:Uncharacterized protein n=1 Tax=Galerina marginata (strain CBS 339.88) TaxID=685588 RepID=A0A067TMN8_GALM3|nr:hypothetical protein GALMADRAFT_153481 [Galerina marginata CBS 339.88]
MASPKKSVKEFGIRDSDPLELNPGPGPRRRSTVTCKCVLWSILVFFGLGGGYLGAKAAQAVYRQLREPHRALYQDISMPYQPQGVVRPLIDHDQTFDIVATVWLRTDRDAVDGHVYDRAPEHQKAEEGLDGEQSLDLPNIGEGSDDSELVEKAILTETILRGLRLKDKNIPASLKFRVPTEIFKKRELNAYDLRGSFVLIPTSPSPLDHALNYSTWIPDSVKYPPSRSWPEGYVRSLEEEVIDEYGTFTPLLSFQNIKSRCGSSTTALTDASEDEDEEENTPSLTTAIKLNGLLSHGSKDRFSSKGKPVLEAHPYVITRSFLRVVDQTTLYNRNAYDKAHKLLKQSSCGEAHKLLSDKAPKPDWRMCLRSYLAHGNQEVKIKVMKTAEDNGKKEVEWIYAPYLSVSESSFGPLDLIPVPVNRERCADNNPVGAQNVPDEEFMDVTWNVTFIGRTPEKISIVDSYDTPKRKYNMTETKDNQLQTHANVELMHGLIGHPFRDNYHPRRVAILLFIELSAYAIAAALKLHYCSSIRRIHIEFSPPNNLGPYAKGAYQLQSIWPLLFTSIISLLKLKAITRVEFLWRGSSLPTMHFAPASHSERASHRMEPQLSRRFKILFFAIVGACLYIVQTLEMYIINPRGTSTPSKTVMTEGILAGKSFITRPALILGSIMQIVMNTRSRSVPSAMDYWRADQ